jgi:hypothetical protein
MRPIIESNQASRRFLIAPIAGALFLLLLVGICIYGLLRGPAAPAPAPRTVTTEAPAVQKTDPEPVAEQTDAEQFTRDLAERLFAWDTTLGRIPVEYMQPIFDITDPDEAPGLASDLRGYVPDDAVWGQLREFSTRQWLTIDTATVPAAWAGIKEQAKPGLLPLGATAYTITGTRHRAGTWDRENIKDARPVAFTIFVACPNDQSCRLLRLSGVDQPLR